MSTSNEYIAFVCEQIGDGFDVRIKKMFGEYMVYCNDKPVLLVCDNTVYVKKAQELSALMQNAGCGYPYDGAKEHYILDVENHDLTAQVLKILVSITPFPKKKYNKIPL